jgi:hypothetical protein
VLYLATVACRAAWRCQLEGIARPEVPWRPKLKPAARREPMQSGDVVALCMRNLRGASARSTACSTRRTIGSSTPTAACSGASSDLLDQPSAAPTASLTWAVCAGRGGEVKTRGRTGNGDRRRQRGHRHSARLGAGRSSCTKTPGGLAARWREISLRRAATAGLVARGGRTSAEAVSTASGNRPGRRRPHLGKLGDDGRSRQTRTPAEADL